ncbi:hypothetical protein ACN47E_002767 [Coniothyrium glycines]
MGKIDRYVLFGGVKGWHAEDWTASDDRVRNGSSQSYLTITPPTALFHGTLDSTTLGGAGFASQRTTNDLPWDLSPYSGIHLALGKHDDKRYTITLKDEVLPLSSDGREQSTTSYEYDFTNAPPEGVFIPWHAFNATYRGTAKDDAEPLDVADVKRITIMMRSFFAQQQGDFELEIKSITAVKQDADGVEKGYDGGKVVRRDEPWSWKNSNLVGLAVILSATWALCFGFCKWKGIETSFMTFSRWWSVVRR